MDSAIIFLGVHFSDVLKKEQNYSITPHYISELSVFQMSTAYCQSDFINESELQNVFSLDCYSLSTTAMYRDSSLLKGQWKLQLRNTLFSFFPRQHEIYIYNNLTGSNYSKETWKKKRVS